MILIRSFPGTFLVGVHPGRLGMGTPPPFQTYFDLQWTFWGIHWFSQPKSNVFVSEILYKPRSIAHKSNAEILIIIALACKWCLVTFTLFQDMDLDFEKNLVITRRDTFKVIIFLLKRWFLWLIDLLRLYFTVQHCIVLKFWFYFC